MNIEAIHNYYEGLVQGRIIETEEYLNGLMDQDSLEDIACVALNQLPTKYVRYSIDLIFYMSQQERSDIDLAVDNAIKKAIDIVLHNKRGLAESKSNG